MSIRILVTGSRTWRNEALVDEAIRKAMARFPGNSVTEFVIVHGDCPSGADRLADEWARANSVEVERHPANWGLHGRKAGMLRNEVMALTWPEHGIAFAHRCPKQRCVYSDGSLRPQPHYTHGTDDMIQRFALHRIPYDLIRED